MKSVGWKDSLSVIQSSFKVPADEVILRSKRSNKKSPEGRAGSSGRYSSESEGISRCQRTRLGIELEPSHGPARLHAAPYEFSSVFKS